MKKLSIVLSALLITLFSFKAVVPSTWKIDGAHSQLRFSAPLLMVSDIEGTFKIKDATLAAPNDDFSDASITITGDMNSIDTDNDQRDTHLKSADYFDTAKYPTFTFKSTSFKKTGNNTYKVTGDLNLHGVTKPVTLNATSALGTHPMSKKTLAGFKATGTIKRSEFGISAATPAAMLGDEVTIVANLQFIKD